MSQEQNTNSQEPQNEVIVKNDGSPFETRQGATLAMNNKQLSPESYCVGEYKEGFAILFRKQVVTPVLAAKHDSLNETLANAEYFRVIFQQKSNHNDEMDVRLALNGTTLVFRRGSETIIPKAYKEIADHAVVDKHEQQPGQSRKLTGKVLTHPYIMMGVATKEDYIALKQSGDIATRNEIQRAQTPV